jgi:hypothetical protein
MVRFTNLHEWIYPVSQEVHASASLVSTGFLGMKSEIWQSSDKPSYANDARAEALLTVPFSNIM